MKLIQRDSFFCRIAILVFIGVFLYILYALREAIAPFAVAFILAYLLNPIVTWLSRYMRRIVAILTVYLMAIIGMIALLVWLTPLIWEQLQTAWGYLPKAAIWYEQVARPWVNTNLHRELPTLQDFGSLDLSQNLIKYIQQYYDKVNVNTLLKTALSSGLSAINNVGALVIIPVLMFYFLLGWQARLQKWQNLIPKAYLPKVLEIAKDCNTALMSFVKGQLLVMLILGIVYALQLQLIGLDLGLIIGLTAGLASFVPYLGFGLGIIAALVAGLFEFGLDWVHLGLIIGAFMIGQIVEGYILQPLLLGDKIGLSPLWVIFAVLAGASLFGFVGMLIALPVSAVINVLLLHALNAYKNSDWYQGRWQLNLFK